MPIYHAGFDLDSIIHRGEAAKMAGLVRLPGCVGMANEVEILAYSVILKAKGFEVLPCCSHYDSKGKCLGHTSMENQN